VENETGAVASVTSAVVSVNQQTDAPQPGTPTRAVSQSIPTLPSQQADAVEDILLSPFKDIPDTTGTRFRSREENSVKKGAKQGINVEGAAARRQQLGINHRLFERHQQLAESRSRRTGAASQTASATATPQPEMTGGMPQMRTTMETVAPQLDSKFVLQEAGVYVDARMNGRGQILKGAIVTEQPMMWYAQDNAGVWCRLSMIATDGQGVSR
jgi:hypothetical protein